jgi:hypothetical protein
MPLLLLLTSGALAMGSPWWKDCTTMKVFLWPNDGRVLLERNEAQGSLLSGRFLSTLFREESGGRAPRPGSSSGRPPAWLVLIVSPVVMLTPTVNIRNRF